MPSAGLYSAPERPLCVIGYEAMTSGGGGAGSTGLSGLCPHKGLAAIRFERRVSGSRE